MRSLTRVALALLLLTFFAFPARADKPQKACRVHYTGKVQGVGFRATAAEIARDYPVAGWVKNLPDGRVELLVQGPEASVEKFLEAIRKRWKDNITKEKLENETPDGKLKGFEIVK
jgi:acylphosphatase